MMAGAFALDPDELLWKPTKKIFIPPATSVEQTWEAIASVMQKKLTPKLIDMVFHRDPLFIALRDAKPGDVIESRVIGFDEVYDGPNRRIYTKFDQYA